MYIQGLQVIENTAADRCCAPTQTIAVLGAYASTPLAVALVTNGRLR